MAENYAIIYFGHLRGGFARRMTLLAEALSAEAHVVRVHTPGTLLRFVRSKAMLRGKTSVIVYSSLMAPLVAILKCFDPELTVYYMVRGDEFTWANHYGRRFRAWIGKAFQKLMRAMNCRFVFVSRDLQEAFTERLGEIAWARILPNTLGAPLGEIRRFDGRVAIVGDFGSVKNIEHVIETLSDGDFQVDLYGNRSLPETYNRDWLHAHGCVGNLKGRLGNSSLVVLASVSEGFPNVLLDALEAGCGVVVHKDFPFRQLP
ncbi:MAG: glycosyltransferase family protein, partial [Planctomycetota bacterium]